MFDSRGKTKTNIVSSVLGSQIISAMVKRIILIEKEENYMRIFFEKGYPLPSITFEIKNRILRWVGIDDTNFDEFKSHSRGKEVADLIRETLSKHPEGLNYSSIKKLLEPFNIN